MRLIAAVATLVVSFPALGAVSSWIPFENVDGHIAVPILLEGEPATAMLDSGATTNSISEQFLNDHPDAFALGRNVRVTGAHGSRKETLVNGVDIELFGVPFEINSLLPMSLGGFDFIIGRPFFDRYVVQIDYPGSRIRIMDHKSVKLGKIDNVKMKRSKGGVRPLVQVDMNGDYKAWLLLDTGSNSGVMISRDKAEQIGWLERYPTVGGTSMGIIETIETESFRMPEFTIGPYTLENVLVSVPAAGEESNIAKDTEQDWSTGTNIKLTKRTDGILGYEVLQHFVLTIDFKRSLMHIGTEAGD